MQIHHCIEALGRIEDPEYRRIDLLSMSSQTDSDKEFSRRNVKAYSPACKSQSKLIRVLKRPSGSTFRALPSNKLFMP